MQPGKTSSPGRPAARPVGKTLGLLDFLENPRANACIEHRISQFSKMKFPVIENRKSQANTLPALAFSA
jgi:hypothetical protein